MPPRSLPQVIGPTEDALRALLGAPLASTAIAVHEHRVALHATSGAGDIEERIRSGLPSSAEEAHRLVLELEDDGMVTHQSGTWTPTGRGADELAAARRDVGDLAARVVSGIADEEMATAVAVLGRTRRHAEAERAEAWPSIATPMADSAHAHGPPSTHDRCRPGLTCRR